MLRFILTAIGFVLLAFAATLVVWSGYEISHIFTGYYDAAEQGIAAVLIGVILMIAATAGWGGRELMRHGRGTSHPASR